MATYTTYDTVGIKEDVSDVISNLSPTKTPFQTMIGSETTKNRTFQWLEDSLRAVQVNAAVEGADASDATLTPPTLRDNTTQILEKTIKVSATEDAVDQYGRAKETAYQLMKAGEEVKRDLEHAFVGLAQAKVVGDSSGPTARKTASASQMVTTASNRWYMGAGTPLGGTTGTAAAFSETALLGIGQAVYDVGGEPSILMIKPADALIVAGFTGASGRSRNFNDGTKSLVNVVDLYVSPFGEYKVVLNRFQKTTDAWLLDPTMWKAVWLRKWTREPLAKTGDATKNQLVGEVGLKHKNYAGDGLVVNLT
ncbi:hypothetical protein BSL82_03360 [Tardibacter chloracetimidivorans]|uniref:Head protein n=1 Tax=Tardibacter chloracetimidivorans TaxID=1921510 RepID=A0A1L3ZS60_9SPHN|nr:DUF5309 family protein [Tardibacter chloracetimidivorans]API58455.1 hypothetical protein BSL82_03360 [Tardibacter chloracetimidivorans]